MSTYENMYFIYILISGKATVSISTRAMKPSTVIMPNGVVSSSIVLMYTLLERLLIYAV